GLHLRVMMAPGPPGRAARESRREEVPMFLRMSLCSLVLAGLVVIPVGGQDAGAGSSSKDEAARQRQEIDRLQKELAESKRRIEQQDRLIAELKEANRLREQLAEAARKAAEQEKTIQELRNRLVQVQIEVQTFRQRAVQLEEALQNFAKQVDKLGTK